MLSLDWVSFTISDDRWEVIDYLVSRLGELLPAEFKSAGGVHGYEFSRRCDGVVIAYGGESQKKTVLVSLSGLACSVLQWYGVAAFTRAIIQRYEVRIKFTRVDLALDVSGEWWQYFDSPDRVYERVKDGRIKTITIVNNYESQEDKSGHSHNWIVTGHTTYIGSRTSERFMRIYKKIKDDGQKVTRFEYELKGRYAGVVGLMMLQGHNVGEAYIFANTNHIDISDIYDLRVLYEETSASLPRKKEKRTFQWLMNISAALVDFIETNPEHWHRVLMEGARRSPVGNTGVQIVQPDGFEDLLCQALNFDTFGTPFHPLEVNQGTGSYFFS